MASFEGKAVIIAAMTAALVLPLLLLGHPRRLPASPGGSGGSEAKPPQLKSAAVRMWVARLLMQIPGAALASYLYFWLRALDPAMADGEKTLLFAGGLSASIVAALFLGRWSDRHGRPFAVLSLISALTGLALAAMALADDPAIAKLAYVLFGISGATFLALHASQTLRVLRNPAQRGLGIGLFNLTNTAPSLVMPWIAISVVPGFGFGRLFLVLALLTLGAAALLATMPRDV